MKKNLLLLLLLALMPWYNKLSAQCDVSNVVISDVRPVQNGTGVDYTIDIAFTAEENNGAKYTWLHLWLEKDYQYNLWHNAVDAPYPCPRPNSSTKAAPTTTAAGFDMLDNSFLTFGFELGAVGTTAGTTGIMTSYIYDPTVVPNYANATIYKQSLGGKLYRVTILNVTFYKANCTCSDYLQVRAFNWATNANTAGGTPVQCYSCDNTPFVIGDPRVTGNINCVYPRTYNLFIDSRYMNAGTPGVDVISGSYTLYADVNRNGKIDLVGEHPDFLVKGVTPFVTDPSPVGGVPVGFQSRFLQLNGTFDYVFAYGDTNSSKSVIALVNIETPGYTGADVTGLLSNTCAVLPVSITRFSANAHSNAVKLTWETAQEFNFSGYEVERKAGNANFVSIGFVQAIAMDGERASYQFTDANLPAGEVLLYRLRLLDKDGSFTYSDVKAIRNNAKKLLVAVYPNPTKGMFTIAVPADAGLYDVMISDYSGRVIKADRSLRNQSLQINKLLPGVYLLKIWFIETGETITERVIVQ
jgi:hypothetical protein